jgi:hypothetical protein
LPFAICLRNLVVTFGTSGLLSTSTEGVPAATTAVGSFFSFNLRFEFLIAYHEQGRVKSAQNITKNATGFTAASVPFSNVNRKTALCPVAE